MEQVMMDILRNKDFAHAYFDRLMEWIRVAGNRYVEMGADIIFIGDDVGAQNRMMISPALFREFLKPRYAELFSAWKRMNPALKIAYHSDGYIVPVIGDLIEVGLDILNPIQPACMDPAEVKRQFGNHLTFWGTVDIQHVLPFGTPADVAAEVKLRCETVGPGGGLILSPAHNIQSEVPIANILAFYEAAQKYGRYPLGR
jgi:uroporphyrinogen decarboxylase